MARNLRESAGLRNARRRSRRLPSCVSVCQATRGTRGFRGDAWHGHAGRRAAGCALAGRGAAGRRASQAASPSRAAWRARPRGARAFRGAAVPRAVPRALARRPSSTPDSTGSASACKATLAAARLPRERLAPRTSPPGRYRRGRVADVRVHRRAFEHPTARRARARHRSCASPAPRSRSMRERRRAARARRRACLEPELVGAYYGPDREQRELVRARRRPAAPRRRDPRGRGPALPEHRGVDFRRIVGALLANLRAGGVAPGRQHAHAAAREELLPDARAQLPAQAPGSRDVA